jgi:NADH:ubiquinone oxidoreductase subunit 3 (subunit A)
MLPPTAAVTAATYILYALLFLLKDIELVTLLAIAERTSLFQQLRNSALHG